MTISKLVLLKEAKTPKTIKIPTNYMHPTKKKKTTLAHNTTKKKKKNLICKNLKWARKLTLHLQNQRLLSVTLLI